MTAVELDLPEVEYHAHPALSSTGAKQLLECPARFDWNRRNGRPPKQAFDLGHAAHRLVLGKGDEFAVVDADSWLTKAAKAARDEAREQHLVPLLTKELAQAQAMADAVRAHPVAGALFQAGTGTAEQSLFWDDEETGVPLRARVDWLRPAAPGGRAIVVDLKTTGASADPRALPRTIDAFHYEQQDDFYRRGVAAVGIDPDAAFLFVFVEKEPPHPVTVVELDVEAKRVGRERNDRAIRLFQECTATGRWPAYGDDIELVTLPSYALYRHDIQEQQ